MKGIITCLSLAFALAVVASPTTTVQFIKIDQFGYLPAAQKIAVIANPIAGYNNTTPFSPGTNYEVRDWATDAVVFTGTITPWNGGATQTQSGDKVWWFDFSSFTTVGSYYIYDVTNAVGSYRFDINDCVYEEALKHTLRMFYYQRCGAAKAAPYAATGWTDTQCHLGTQQDSDCRLYNNTSSTTSKNLSGGWHDAGDYNKYVNFTWSTLLDLMLAYEENPTVWPDNYNIPESGNGTPDLLDEIKFELDWLLKMQNSDGSVICVIGGGGASPPSGDTQVRRYGPATTSATFSSAGIFALAAIQFNAIGQTAYATTLQTAATNAWTWATANPGITFYNAGTLAAGEQELGTYEASTRQFAAAVYLYALTGSATYKTYVDNNYNNVHLLQWTFAYPFEGAEQDALLYYTKTPGATTGVRTAILNAYTSSMSTGADNLGAYNNNTDAYRAWLTDNNYTWNSNQTKSKLGIMFNNMNTYNLNSTNSSKYKNAAEGVVHYMNGVNPNTKCYISNMGNYGSENSVTQFYHGWFENGSAAWDEVGVSTFGPPPGFIPGGPNPSYALDGCCPSSCGSAANNALCNTNVTPPLNQPIQKSYKDFNDSWPVNSWTISEAGIYTNAAYVRMLSKCFSQACGVTTAISHSPTNYSMLIQTIYPQPAQNKITLKFYDKADREITYALTDISGKEIVSKKASPQNGLLDIELSHLTAGAYFIKVSSADRVEVKKVVVGK